MKNKEKWFLPRSQQLKYIDALTAELAPLRARLGISQNDLSSVIGVSRQTYSAIEGGHKRMSWHTYLSLILFYDYNSATHQILRNIGAFPEDLVTQFNDGVPNSYIKTMGLAGIPDSVTSKLDDAAYQAIRTVIMLEYARCENLPGEAVIKSFEGVVVNRYQPSEDAAQALKAIKESRGRH